MSLLRLSAPVLLTLALASLTPTAPAQATAASTDAEAPPPDAEREVLRRAIGRGLDWLLAHQDEDGRWSASTFVRHDPQDDPCSGPGKPGQDLAVTACATIALTFAGRHDTERDAAAVRRAAGWLGGQLEAWLDREPRPEEPLAQLALATWALIEYSVPHDDGDAATTASHALRRLLQFRRDDGGWPATVGGDAVDADTTVFAFAAQTIGSMVQRAPIPADPDEALAHAPPEFRLMRHAYRHQPGQALPDLRAAEQQVLATPPEWPTAERPCDFVARALAALFAGLDATPERTAWCRGLQTVVLQHQRDDGSHRGSWDPVDVRGKTGGRVQSTALHVWTLHFLDRAALMRARR
ncbi:MAG: hypothetical protein AB7O97_22895 [Planctomycetota bacterium]